MIGKKINQLATELAPTTTDLTIIGDPISGVSKKITLEQLGAIFGGAVSFYTTLGDFPATGVIDIIYCAKDTKKLYLWSGSAYVEVFPSQALLDTYQLRSEKGNANGYASLDSSGKVPISQLPSSIMEYKGTWSAATNTPTLANGTGDTGDVYLCNAAGTVNFGAGPLTFAVGDYVVYSGTIWQRSSGAVGTVTSVGLSITGDAIGVSNSPITTSGTLALAFAGNSTQYINGAGNLVTFPGIINEAQNLITEVYNKTGATLTKGTVVYINGGQGNLPSVTKALATGDSTSAQTYGIVRNDITNNNNGYVVVAGRISDLDTQAYTEGTQLYLSPTTAGTYTSTKPYAPNHLVYVGIVVRAHPTQGVVEVKIQNGYELDELHNVAAQNPDNNDILQYKTATSLWTKVAGTTSNIAEGSNLYYTDARSRAAISLTTTGSSGAASYNNTTGVLNVPQYAPDLSGYVPTSRTLTINGTAYDLSANRSWSVGTVTSVGLSSATSGVTIGSTPITTSGTITLAIATASGSQQGLLSSTDWTTFNNKQSALTNPVTGTGTTNYLPKFTGTSTIGDSSISDVASSPLSIVKNASSSTSNLIFISPTTGTNASILNLDNAGAGSFYIGRQNSAGASVLLSGLGAYASVVGHTGSQTLHLVTNALSRVQIDGSGNLGLGVTPSAWGTSNSARALQLNAGSLFSFQTSQLHLEQNSYFNGSGFIYTNNGFASAYRQVEGAHYWVNAPSGTAGNAISFTQAMTLNASGNLSVGNTNDTYKLDVSGTGRFTGVLTGTSATFSGILTVTSSSGTKAILATTRAFGVNRNFQIAVDEYEEGQFTITPSTTQGGSGYTTPIFKLAATGAATFSSSVTATIFDSTSNAFRFSGNNALSLVSLSGQSVVKINAAGYWGTQLVGANDQGILINNTGQVGIGTTNPGYKLNVVGGNEVGSRFIVTGTYAPIQFSGDNSTTLGGINAYSGIVAIGRGTSTGVNPDIAINSSGNVGIGTTSPQGGGGSTDRTLSINSGSGAASFVTGLVGDVKYSTLFTASSIVVLETNAAIPLAFNTNATERMRITSGGDIVVGGTTAINSSSGRGNITVNGTSAIINLGISNVESGYIFHNGTNLDIAQVLAQPLRFLTTNTERMRITSGGNVGIGTTSPTTKLDVVGDIKTGEPDTGYGRAAFKIGTRQSGSATGTGGYIPISIDGTVYFINLFTSTP